MFPKEKVYSIGDSESDLSMKKYSEEMFYTGAEKIPGIISVKNITEALKKIRDEDYESTVSSVR